MGIASGSVIAGIVGKKKYLYDIMEIKKETSKSCQAKALPGENPFLDDMITAE